MDYIYFVFVVWDEPSADRPDRLYRCRDRYQWRKTSEYLSNLCGSSAYVGCRQSLSSHVACDILYYIDEQFLSPGRFVELFPRPDQTHQIREAENHLWKVLDVAGFDSYVCEHHEADSLFQPVPEATA